MVARKHDDATLIRALAQNSNAKAAALLDLDIRNVERHRSRLIRLGLLQPASAPVEMANATAETYVITAAVNATKVHSAFLKTLQLYCSLRGARLIVIPMRYKNPTRRDEVADDDWWDARLLPYITHERTKIAPGLVVLADIKIQPTAVKPLQGWLTVSGRDSAILGHTKIALESVATRMGDPAKLVLTTGACTVEQYSDTNASKKGGASYLEGIIGLIMSVYSKANGYLPITGDLKEEIREKLRQELARVEKRIDDLPADSSSDMARGRLERHSAQLRTALEKIDDGLDSPYLTILGYTTPVTFESMMGFEQATNGFMARAMIFSDLETNPRRKKEFVKKPMSETLAQKICNLYAPGRFDMLDPDGRIEFTEDKTVVPTTPEGAELLSMVYERFHGMAEEQKGTTGLEAIPRRGYELAAKVSLVLALPSGLRTAEHVLWGYALAMRDVEQKIKLAHATEKPNDASGLAARILALVTHEHGETLGVICNRLRSTPKAQVVALLKQMVDAGMLKAVESIHPYSGKPVERYFSGG
jgi:hypothetical protein